MAVDKKHVAGYGGLFIGMLLLWQAAPAIKSTARVLSAPDVAEAAMAKTRENADQIDGIYNTLERAAALQEQAARMQQQWQRQWQTQQYAPPHPQYPSNRGYAEPYYEYEQEDPYPARHLEWQTEN